MENLLMEDIDDDSIDASPNPSSLALSMRAFGYDITTAIADILDNSITACARNIWINFEWDERESTITIIDDGNGMTPARLIQAMTLGTDRSDFERASNDLGRFGLGLKTASFSQCKTLTVATKAVGEEPSCKRWDIDVVVLKNKWRLLTPPREEREELFGKIGDHGTVVEWANLDKVFQKDSGAIANLADYFLSIAEEVREHIGMTYSSFQRGNKPVYFWINGRKIEMWEPFLADNSYTTLLGEEPVCYSEDNKVVIRPYILPHHSKLSAEEHSKAAGTRGWNDQQGFYVYRNNRLIIDGDWLNPRLEKKEAYRLARIRIDIDNKADDIWGIDVKKAKAQPPASLKKDLRRIATLARKESAKIFRHRGKSVVRSSDKNNSFLWEQKNKDNKYFFAINRQHPLIKMFYDEVENQVDFERILKLLESGVPTPLIRDAEANNPNGELPAFANLSDKDIKEWFRDEYNHYIKFGKSHNEAVALVASSEPFMYFPEIIEQFK
jgi:hypothetical protein